MNPPAILLAAATAFAAAAAAPAAQAPELSDSAIVWSLAKENPASIALVPAPRELKAASGTCPATAETKFATDPAIAPEGYELSISPEGVTIKSSDAAGAFYARMTLAQIERFDPKTRTTFYPCLEIKDSPQYRWRGVHLDEARHFFGKETVMRILDLMALHKMNRFHWHLTDESGWRIEIPKYPELVRKGAVRAGKMRHRTQPRQRKLDGQPYGPFFYTEADIKEIVAYAAERHIAIVPEIEFPAHCYAALVAYPELTCFPENVRGAGPKCVWGQVRDFFCVGNDDAIRFMEDVLAYIAELFPGDVIHIGGDECPVAAWKKCPKCQARIKAEGLGDEKGLQPWLTRHFTEFLEKRGKRAVGWDEYLAGDIPQSAIGMSWRAGAVVFGHEFMTPLECVRRGHDMVMAPHSHCYLNNSQCLRDDPFQYTGGRITLEKCYSFDPCEGIPDELRGRILGGQCCNWTEFTWNEYDLEWKMWPRACAIAEVLWTGDAKPGFDDFKRRIVPHRRRLVSRGVNCANLK